MPHRALTRGNGGRFAEKEDICLPHRKSRRITKYMKIIFFGAGKLGREALELFETENKTADEVIGFADNRKTGSYCGRPILPVGDVADKDTAFVITVEDPYAAAEIYYMLKAHGFSHIYCFLNRRSGEKTYDDFLQKECLSAAGWGDCVLPQVEMHIADYCNLNCRGCTHFSPIFEKALPDLEGRLLDVRRLKEKFSYILHFSILGGEPFLNQEIARYVTKLREILPDTYLQIVTNGLLIPSLDQTVLDTIRENRVVVSISEYKPTHRMIGQIRDILEANGIDYIIRPFESKEKFLKPLTLSEHTVHPHKCISNGCVNIWEGKIARCRTLMYIDKFNETFGTNLPNQGIMELANCPSGAKLLEELAKEVPLCGHCVACEIEWENCKAKPVLNDFAAED